MEVSENKEEGNEEEINIIGENEKIKVERRRK